MASEPRDMQADDRTQSSVQPRTPGAGAAASGSAPALRADQELTAGTKLGKYQIKRILGRGGMGAVYQAADLVLKRDVALKVLPSSFAEDEQSLKRFLREAQSAARLNHPNVVAVYDIARQGAIYFIAMELVLGKTAQDALSDQGDWRAVVRCLADVCKALDLAHREGLVHRDIKPGNILCSTSGVNKLSDFGLAKSVSQHRQSITQADTLLGTPNYMSPEQCENRKLDQRSDIYSLGATAFALLTGHPPFEGDSVLQVLYQHVHVPPPDPRKLNPKLPPGITAILQKAMAKKPSDRYASAAQMLADLEALLADKAPAASEANLSSANVLAALEGIEPTTVTPVAQPGKSQGMDPSIVVLIGAGAAAVLALLILGFALSSGSGRKQNAAEGEAGIERSAISQVAQAPAKKPEPAEPLQVNPNPSSAASASTTPADQTSAAQSPAGPATQPSPGTQPASGTATGSPSAQAMAAGNTVTAPQPAPLPDLPALQPLPQSAATSPLPAPPSAGAPGSAPGTAPAVPAQPTRQVSLLPVTEEALRDPLIRAYFQARQWSSTAYKTGKEQNVQRAALVMILWADYFGASSEPAHRSAGVEAKSLAEQYQPGISGQPRGHPGIITAPLPPPPGESPPAPPTGAGPGAPSAGGGQRPQPPSRPTPPQRPQGGQRPAK